MSFSGEVKKELCEQFPAARHCKIAELSAIVVLCRKKAVDKYEESSIKLQTESSILAKKAYLLIKQTFGIAAELNTAAFPGSRHSNTFELVLAEQDAKQLLGAISNPAMLNRSCCKRSYIRGAFLASGSITDPKKGYHFEIVAAGEEQGKLLCECIASFNIEAKMIKRKQHFVVYVKEGSQIVDLLNVMEAHVALMEFENVRIIKDMRNSVNRQVNCETANINKTVNAAKRQVEAIRSLQESGRFALLAEPIKEVALLRIEFPEASLKELGEMLIPPVGKSGVNHRLMKLCEFAEQQK